MASREPRLSHEAKMRDLLATYRQAQRDIAAMVRAAVAAQDLRTAARRRAQLVAVQVALDRLGVYTDPAIRALVAQAVTDGSERVRRDMIGARITAPEIPGAFHAVSADALLALQDAATGRLVGARQTVGRTVEDLYARAGRRAAVRAVLGADGSPEKARRALMADLRKDPVVQRLLQNGGQAFIDKAGRGWSLADYSDMVVRTTTRQAVTQGALARMAAHGIDLARVSRHASSCAVCKPWEGRLVALNGDTASYEGEAVADLAALPNGGPPFHPRCKHSLQPVAARVEQFRRQLAAA